MTWLNLGEMLNCHAKKNPRKLALKDWSGNSFTYHELNSRINRLANGLLSLGLKKNDRVAVMLHNCTEFVEIYCASAKVGLVVTPISWRYVHREVRYVLEDSDAKAIITHSEFAPLIDQLRPSLTQIPPRNFIVVGNTTSEGYSEYESLINNSSDRTPKETVDSKDVWAQIYTSGTTGFPKGVVRSHESYVAFFMINAIEFGFSEKDYGMVIMPFFHVNSTFYGLIFLYIGASLFVGKDKGFDPLDLLRTVERERISFISLIPTHYSLILDVGMKRLQDFNTSSLSKLLCSSAPARGRIKRRILEAFPSVELYEGYGSTEAGLVTILKPEDQLRKIGSIGRVCLGTDLIKVLDEDGQEVGVDEIGELFSRGPMMFDGYHKKKEKTKASFRGRFFSAGDLVTCDEDGYYYIVDRKDNMIITGGEHAYPSEIEEVVAQHSEVADVAVVGLPDDKWGEAITAVVVRKKGSEVTEKAIVEWCKGKMAGYKKPKKVIFIEYSKMPRSATGKILHRELRERFSKEN